MRYLNKEVLLCLSLMVNVFMLSFITFNSYTRDGLGIDKKNNVEAKTHDVRSVSAPEEISLDAQSSLEHITQNEFSRDIAYLILYAQDLGYDISLGECYRTMYQQRHNVKRGVSWTYNSKHLKRRACDLNLFKEGKYLTKVSDYKELGEFWKVLNPKNIWGGDWKKTPDALHFQRNK